MAEIKQTLTRFLHNPTRTDDGTGAEKSAFDFGYQSIVDYCQQAYVDFYRYRLILISI